MLESDPAVVLVYAKAGFIDGNGNMLDVHDPGWDLRSDYRLPTSPVRLIRGTLTECYLWPHASQLPVENTPARQLPKGRLLIFDLLMDTGSGCAEPLAPREHDVSIVWWRIAKMNATYLAELWRFRELVYFLAWRDVKVRYKQAALGAAWAVLQPLLSMVVFTLFFGRLAGIPSDNVPYPLFSYSALLLWTYFAGVLGQGGLSLVSNSNLITKVYFPRVALPASPVLSGLLDFVVGLGLLVILMGYYGIKPGWSVLLAPVFLAALVLFTLGAAMFLAAMNVSYRDIKYVVPFLIQMWLFVTPVIYPTTFLPKRLQTLMALNPLAGIIEGFRSCLFSGRPLDPTLTAVSLSMTVFVFVVGLTYFRTAERAFADVI
jgi:lipopolysaccharide transport system permease protein